MLRVQWIYFLLAVGAWAADGTGTGDGQRPEGNDVDGSGQGSEDGLAWLERMLGTIEAGTSAWAPVEGTARASISATALEDAAASVGHTSTVDGAASEGPTATIAGQYSASDTGSTSVAADRMEETGSAGGALTKASDGVDVATGGSVSTTAPEDEDELLRRRQAMVEDAKARLQKRLRKLRRRAERKAAAAATAEVTERSGGDGSTATGSPGGSATGGGSLEGRTEENRTVALVNESTPALTEANGGGARTVMAGARRWVDFGLAIAQQLEQRAAALRLREDQSAWVEDRFGSTTSGPTTAQISALLDRMPDELRFPPELLDALLLEAVGGGAYVDMTDGGFDVPEKDVGGLETTSKPSGARSEASGTLDPKEEAAASEAPEDEAEGSERSASEMAVLGPVPESWLIAAKSWHKARRAFARGDVARREAGFRCPCARCQRGDGRFRAADFRTFVQHLGGGPLGFRFHCPFDKCKSTRKTREQFFEHLKQTHRLDTKEADAAWLRKQLGCFQSTARGPTQLDPFFREGTNVLVDEPLPPREWRAYLASLCSGAADENGSGSGAEVELEEEGGGRDVEDGQAEAPAEAQGSSGTGQAEVDGNAEFAEAAAAAVAAGVSLLAASGGEASGTGRSKKKASKRSREEPEGSGTSKERSKKRKPEDEDPDYTPDSGTEP